MNVTLEQAILRGYRCGEGHEFNLFQKTQVNYLNLGLAVLHPWAGGLVNHDDDISRCSL